VVLTVVVSLLAAVLFGTAMVLQHRGANRVRRRFPLHPGLLHDLARQKWWLLGSAVEAAAVILHVVAVNVGPLSVVQPLMTVGLLVALPLQALLGRPIGRGSYVAAALTVTGLAMFVGTHPAGRSPSMATTADWPPGLLFVGAVAVAVLVVALSQRGVARSLGLGAAAGALFALTAGLAKTWGALLYGGGIAAVASSWQLWTAVAASLAGTMLSQAAFQAGALGPVLAATMVADPVVGVSLGMIVFDEHLAAGPLVILQGAGLLLTLVGVWRLATTESTQAILRAADDHYRSSALNP
jgi:hypothetical protein